MTRMMLGCGLAAALAVSASAPVRADGPFWVVGSHDTGKCEIVTANPVIDGGNIWFGDGPYRSRSDAKLARSTITACPKVDPGKEDDDEK